MPRCLAQVLCFVALLVQVLSGALPSGKFCVGSCSQQPIERSCCCAPPQGPAAEHDRALGPLHNHLSTRGCPQCLHIATPACETTIGQRITPPAPDAGGFSVLPSIESRPGLAAAPLHRALRERGHESPPHLGPLNITRLII